jgi:transcription elongation factor GreB
VSKAFVKDEQSEAVAIVPPRAPLPDGVTNYVTPRGLELLREELAALGAERARLAAPSGEGGAALRELARRRTELEQRLASAVVVDRSELASDEVRFGAVVCVRCEDGRERRYQIVGVDEADANAGKIAFVAPLARALLGRRAGDSVLVPTPRGEEELEIVQIETHEPV